MNDRETALAQLAVAAGALEAAQHALVATGSDDPEADAALRMMMTAELLTRRAKAQLAAGGDDFTPAPLPPLSGED